MNNPNSQRREFTRQLYRNNYFNFFMTMFSVLLQAGANLLAAWAIQQVIDAAAGVDTALSIGQSVLAGILLISLFLLSYLIAKSFKPRFISRAMEQYKNYAFQRLSQKSVSAFSSENTSRYISALSNDANTIENDYVANIFDLTYNILQFFVGLAMMFYYSPILAVSGIALTLLPILASVFAGNRAAQAETVVAKTNQSFLSTLKDSLGGFSVIKSFQAEKAICDQFEHSVKQTADAKCHRRQIGILIEMFGTIAGIVDQMGVFLLGAWMALHGMGITPGMLSVFIELMNYVANPIGYVPQLLANRKAAHALVDKLAASLSENVHESGTISLDKIECGITLDGVSFSYDKEKNVLQDININFERGKSYAIVGASGCGKSTLLNLLMAGQNSYQGTICYDDVELRDLHTDSLYEMVSIIQQNVFIFNSTIRDNITMFRDFPKEEVERVIRLSGLTKLIEQRGESYLCGENGSGLSGGEKQRISIARSLLRNSSVLLVDEATAALDSQTAAYVTGSILDLQGLTRIVVTHDLDAAQLKRYDSILTLHGGKIAESGRFEQLMEQKGYFYSLYTISQ